MITAKEAAEKSAEAFNKKNKRLDELVPLAVDRIVATINERIAYSVMDGNIGTHYKTDGVISFDYGVELIAIPTVLEYCRNNGYSADVEYSETENGSTPSFMISISWV